MALVRIIQPTSCIKDHGALHRRADELDGFGRHVLVELGKARQPTCLAGSDPSASGPGRARWHHELKALQQDKLDVVFWQGSTIGGVQGRHEVIYVLDPKRVREANLPNDDAAHDAATKITRLLERGRNRLCKSSAPERRKAGKP